MFQVDFPLEFYVDDRYLKMFCIFQAAISTERLKALEWMERHNREKENLRDLQVRLSEKLVYLEKKLYSFFSS